MCGLAGFVSFDPSKHTHHKKRFMCETLYMNALRGMDSTGIAMIDKDMKSEIYKRAMPSFDFLQLGPVEKLLDRLDGAVIALGHTRSSTKGMVSNKNAHPFQHGGITLIHNGHINNSRTLATYLELDADVDSEFVAYGLSKAKDPIEVLQTLDGAFCLVWHDAEKHTFNVARNKERPLTWAYIDDWNGLAFASEMGMLGATLERVGVTMSLYNKEKFPSYWSPDPNILYTWDLKEKDVKRYVTRPFVRTYPKYIAPPLQNFSESTRTWDGESLTSDLKTTPEDTETNTKVWPMRAVLAKHSKKWRPFTAKQKKKNDNRLRGLGINIQSIYGVVPTMWYAYEEGGQNGFVIGRMTIENKGKPRRVLMHNVPQNYYRDNWRRVIAVRMESAYGMQGLGTWACGTVTNPAVTLSEALETLEGSQQSVVDQDTGVVEDFFEGPLGEWMTEAEWNKAVEEHGDCQGCAQKPDINRSDEVLWLDNELFCAACVNNTDMQGYIELAKQKQQAKDVRKDHDERYH